MDIASIALHFLCAAVAGFLIMSIFGVQALVALCSSISLARRRKHQVPDFDLTPNDRKNQRRFEKMFADCYPYEDELDGDDDF